MSQTPEITAKSWLMVFALGLVWGGTFMFVTIALRGVTPFWLAEMRLLVAAAVLVVVWGLRGWRLFEGPATPRLWAMVALVGALNTALPFSFLSWGQQFVPSAFAGVSMATVPLMVLPLAHFLVPGERMHLRRVVGFLIGFIGVLVLIGGAAFAGGGGEMANYGRAACIAAAACYALTGILVRRLPPVDRVGLSAMLMLTGAVWVMPVALSVEGAPVLPPVDTLWVILFLGLVPTALMALLQVAVTRSAGPVFMSLTNYQVPVWSVILGAWVLGEALPPSLFLALGLILSGVCLSQLGALRRLFGKA